MNNYRIVKVTGTNTKDVYYKIQEKKRMPFVWWKYYWTNMTYADRGGDEYCVTFDNEDSAKDYRDKLELRKAIETDKYIEEVVE